MPESDLDMAVLIEPDHRDVLEREWQTFRASSEAIRRLPAVHLDLIDGAYEPTVWDDGGGPDDFELEIGNHVAYSVPLWQVGQTFEGLRARWLPYYEEALRTDRLVMVRHACFNDLDLIPTYANRELYFQAFDNLYKAFREFLQALFIARRTYPVSYSKWIRWQVGELLQAPGLYAELPAVLEVPSLESSDLLVNAERLRELATNWLRQ